MNTLKTIFCGYALLSVFFLSAQEKSFPQNIPYHTKMEVSAESLENLFHSNGVCSISLSPALSVTGTVLSRTEKGSSVTTLLIRTEHLQGALLSLSRSARGDGSFQYTGHLLKLHDPDGMLLVEKDNHYYFIRTEQRFLVAE
jgi:hypothetical protein